MLGSDIGLLNALLLSMNVVLVMDLLIHMFIIKVYSMYQEDLDSKSFELYSITEVIGGNIIQFMDFVFFCLSQLGECLCPFEYSNGVSF